MSKRAFDIIAARKGARVVTKCGYPARVIGFSKTRKTYPVDVKVLYPSGHVYQYAYTITGQMVFGKSSIYDLIMDTSNK